jgi:hypothetical protein
VPPQHSPLAFHVALTALGGLTYEIGRPRGSSSTAITYADGKRFVLRPGGGVDQLVEPAGRAPLDAALASAAHPAGFAPQLLDRRDDIDTYQARGITDLPPDPHLWYVDGGLVQTEPIGNVVAAARSVAGGRPGRRLHVMVDPRNEDPSGARAWRDPTRSPSWTAALARAAAILPSQVLYDDLRGIEADNGALARVDAVADALAPALAAGGALPALCDALAAAGHDPGEVDGDGPALLRHLLALVAGVEGKEPVEVGLVSPLLVARPAGRPVPALLAGEFLGTFGGFLRRELRESDFALGWRSALCWLPDGLARVGVADPVASAVLAAVGDRRERSWREVNRGDAALSGLPLAARVTLARLVLHTVRVLVGGRRWIPGLEAVRRRLPAR